MYAMLAIEEEAHTQSRLLLLNRRREAEVMVLQAKTHAGQY